MSDEELLSRLRSIEREVRATRRMVAWRWRVKLMVAAWLIVCVCSVAGFYYGERYERREWHWALSKCATDILRGVHR